MRAGKRNHKSIVAVLIFFAFLAMAAWIENSKFQTTDMDVFVNMIKKTSEKGILYQMFPVYGYAQEIMWQEEHEGMCQDVIKEIMPLYSYLSDSVVMKTGTEDYETFYALAYCENMENGVEPVEEEAEHFTYEFYDEMMNENRHAVIFIEDEGFLTEGCGFVSEISASWVTGFVKATGKSVNYDTEQLQDYEFIIENFYTVDACTAAREEILNPEILLQYNATVDKTQAGPHILIYHTHSQEAFADSVPGDKSTTIVGAGAKLAELLREEYGYEVYHHTGEYDADTRDDAYAKSAPALEEILEQYPQIQVVIDLHRDGVAESRHLVTNWEGRDVAQFMFFNGLSYLNTKGNIDYLPNPNLQGNLATSFQATVIANEYYPGLARRTYLNGYRYNMHYREKTLLIELGAQTNTVDEIMNACEPLAHVLDMVFSGEENTN